MNRVVLTGRLTRDPEMRSLASGKTVTTFCDAVAQTPGGPDQLAAQRGIGAGSAAGGAASFVPAFK